MTGLVVEGLIFHFNSEIIEKFFTRCQSICVSWREGREGRVTASLAGTRRASHNDVVLTRLQTPKNARMRKHQVATESRHGEARAYFTCNKWSQLNSTSRKLELCEAH